jgi:hypothetical protein
LALAILPAFPSFKKSFDVSRGAIRIGRIAHRGEKGGNSWFERVFALWMGRGNADYGDGRAVVGRNVGMLSWNERLALADDKYSIRDYDHDTRKETHLVEKWKH